MKDEEYLDEKFPKGETKFRGEAIVLLALARQVGKQEAQKIFEEMIDRFKERKIDYTTSRRRGINNILDGIKSQLTEEDLGGKGGKNEKEI